MRDHPNEPYHASRRMWIGWGVLLLLDGGFWFALALADTLNGAAPWDGAWVLLYALPVLGSIAMFARGFLEPAAH